MKHQLLAVSAVALSSTLAHSQNVLNLQGNVEAWNFNDGTSFQSSDSSFSNGTISAYVDTSGGFGETNVLAQVTDQPGFVEILLDTQVSGNGAWSMQMTFDLEDSMGEGWMVDIVGSSYFQSKISFEVNDASGTPGVLTDTVDGLVASAGSYRLTVDDPFWTNLFDPDGIFDETWTDASGEYYLRLTQVPSPSILSICCIGGLYSTRRKR
jgi:hypothetical protein